MGKSTLKNIVLAVVALFGATFALAMPAMGQVIGSAAAATNPSPCGEWSQGQMELSGRQSDYSATLDCSSGGGKTRYWSNHQMGWLSDKIDQLSIKGEEVIFTHESATTKITWTLRYSRRPDGEEVLTGTGVAYNTPMRVTVYPTVTLRRKPIK